jgi:hypothetical protein
MSNSLATGVAFLDPEFSTVYATQEIGYAADAQGTVTQSTNKATAVTINKSAGRITMSNSSVTATTNISFNMNNSTISAKDVLILNVSSGATPAAYNLWVNELVAGQANITLRNTTAGALAEAIVINFAIIHGQ